MVRREKKAKEGNLAMKFFIDTADINEIREAKDMGLLDGVTTNPSLIAKTGRPFQDVIDEICELVDGPISAEVVSTDAEGIIEEAKKLVKIHPNIVVKSPINYRRTKGRCLVH